MRAVDPTERRRLQFFLDVRHAPAQQVGLRPDMQAHVVVRGFDPVDRGNAQEQHAAGVLDRHALDEARRHGSRAMRSFARFELTLERALSKGFSR